MLHNERCVSLCSIKENQIFKNEDSNITITVHMRMYKSFDIENKKCAFTAITHEIPPPLK